ncbi:MAG: hypothetical protein Q9169_000835 [Polycauliona sp. 2 TL-2023]
MVAGYNAKSPIVWIARLIGYPVSHPTRWSTWRNFNPHRRFCSPIALRITVRVRRAHFSTQSLIQEFHSSSLPGASLSQDADLRRPEAPSDRDESTIAAVEPIIRQVNTTRIGKRKNARPQVEKLAIYQRGKAFRNQMLKDRGSWSYDWRLPLQDLERCHVPNDSGGSIPLSTPRVTRITKVSHNLRADHIKPPPIWTEPAFHAHVIQLTSSKVDRLVARQIYSKAETHTVAVADALARLFADPSLKYFVSVEAGNVALKFLFNKGMIARGQDLFGQLQELQKDSNPSTYNIMLGAAAEQKDLHTLTYLLKMMIIHRVSPNAQTWLHLARAVGEDEVRTIIINRMGEKGLLSDASIMKEAIAILMPQLVVKYLDTGNTADDLIGMLDDRYGPGWCSTSSAEPLIDGVGLRHSTEKAMMIMRKLCDRGYRPTQGMLLLLLRQCSWDKDHEQAVRLLFHFRTEHATMPSMQVYDLLFMQAWRSQLYNCCRVLWIHACVTGHTSFNMQQMVRQSLSVQRHTSPLGQSRSNTFKTTAGKVILGHGGQNNVTRFRALMSSWKPTNDGHKFRDSFLRAMRSIQDDDLAAVGHYQIREPLDELLREALRMDQQWALGRVLKHVPVECKYSQLIHVKMIPNRSINATHDVHLGGNPSDDEKTDSATCCWMNDSMRSRPCTCLENTKKERDTIPDLKSDEQEATAEASCSSGI